MPYTIEPPAKTDIGTPPPVQTDKYTVEPPAVAAKPDRFAGLDPEPAWHEKLLHGFQAPLIGLDTLASQIEQHLPFVSAETAKSDLETAQKQQQEFEKRAPTGFSGLEVVGNMLNPLNYLLGGKVTGLGSAIGRGAAVGAGSELVQPDTQPGEDFWSEKLPREVISTTIGGAAGAIAEPLAKAISGRSPGEVDKFVQDNFMNAVKPSSAGKGAGLNNYKKRIQTAVATIIANKANLRLTDEFKLPAAVNATGKHIGSLPESLSQFTQAIDQSKDVIFKSYNTMAKDATNQGAMVSTSGLKKELDKVANSVVTKTISPNVAKYAEDLSSRLAGIQQLSPLDAQEMIAHINTKLHSGAPTYDTSALIGVDSLVAGTLRTELDKAVEKFAGPGYQQLKNLYGSLRTIENDVVRRAFKYGQQGSGGGGLIGNIGDVVSGEQVISGVVHGNVPSVAIGAGVKGYTMLLRHLRNPNRAIKRLFELAEKGPTSTPTSQVAGNIVNRAAPVGGVSLFDALAETRPQ